MFDRKLIFFAIFALTLCTVDAQTSESSRGRMSFSGYSGGMMIHTGYVQGSPFSLTMPDGHNTVEMKMKGVPYGIGGTVKLQFGKHLRAGFEGYVTTLNYGGNGCHESIGWGGLLADCVWMFGKWTIFAGGTVGGGSVKNLTLLEKPDSDFLVENATTSYRKYGFVALTPFVGVEYAVLERIHLVLKTDGLFNVSNFQPDFVTGPRIYFGVMFCHLKQ